MARCFFGGVLQRIVDPRPLTRSLFDRLGRRVAQFGRLCNIPLPEE